MKKYVIILLCMLALFAVASCKNDPSVEPDPAPTPEPTPAEPIEEAGVLFVKPAKDCTWDDGDDENKFQFRLDVSFKANEAIALYAKFSDDVTEVAIRQALGANTKFKVNGSEYQQLADLEQDEDGWYIVTIPAESVTPTDGGVLVDEWIGLGISVHLPKATKANGFVAIKGLKLGEDYFDIAEWDENDCAVPYYNKPSKLDVTLTLD